MQVIDINTSYSEQLQRVDLDGFACEIRVYWSENPNGINGEDGQFFMDIKNDIFDYKNIALTIGSEFFFYNGRSDFGGFICVDESQNFVNPTHGGDWSLLYIPINEVDAIRELLNAV